MRFADNGGGDLIRLRVSAWDSGSQRGEDEKDGQDEGPAATQESPPWTPALPDKPGGHDQAGAGAAVLVWTEAIIPPPRTWSPS